MKRYLALAAIVPALAFGVVACGDDESDEAAGGGAATTEQPAPGAEETTAPDIVAVAQDTPDLSTLVTAVTTAELVETLQGDGPFTVFAPTNAAFEALGEEQVQTLLEPENREQLTSILTYHVVEGEVAAADLSDGQTIDTVNGETLEVSIEGDEVKINDATVTMPDVEASNGIVHVIDGVLTP